MTVLIHLKNANDVRLTVSHPIYPHTDISDAIQYMVMDTNISEEHGKYGPWTIVNYSFSWDDMKGLGINSIEKTLDVSI